jgi:hypothetical protein
MSGGMGQPVNQKKFSDHFPTTITVTEADRVGSRNNSGGTRGAGQSPQRRSGRGRWGRG